MLCVYDIYEFQIPNSISVNFNECSVFRHIHIREDGVQFSATMVSLSSLVRRTDSRDWRWKKVPAPQNWTFDAANKMTATDAREITSSGENSQAIGCWIIQITRNRIESEIIFDYFEKMRCQKSNHHSTHSYIYIGVSDDGVDWKIVFMKWMRKILWPLYN